jgi:hypothetical protein
MLGVSCVLIESSKSGSGGGDQAAEFWLRFTIRLTRTLVLNDETFKENCGWITIFRHDLYTIWTGLSIPQIWITIIICRYFAVFLYSYILIYRPLAALRLV